MRSAFADFSPRRTGPVVFHDFDPPKDDFLAAVLAGLGSPQKSLPCRFLYDGAGSALFDKICDLPEYYPTRTETQILQSNAKNISSLMGENVELIELGSGSSTKVRILLDALRAPSGYIPIDISRDHLLAAAQALQDDYPELDVQAICADYGSPFPLPGMSGRRFAFFPGSTIGNLTPAQAGDFLKLWSARLGRGGGLLVGVDLQKDQAILKPAYDDAQGVTAAFSRNLLVRANRELGANFDVTDFEHVVNYDKISGRLSIHLRAGSGQMVNIEQRSFRIAAGETIHIEDSWKYTIGSFQFLAKASAFRPVACWTDPEQLFSVHLLAATPGEQTKTPRGKGALATPQSS